MKNPIKIPVFGSSDTNCVPIGHMEVDWDALPNMPRFCFALIYKSLPGQEGPMLTDRTKWALKAVFVSSDEEYEQFLKYAKEKV